MAGRKYTGYAQLLIEGDHRALFAARGIKVPGHWAFARETSVDQCVLFTWFVEFFGKKSELLLWIEQIKALAPYIYGNQAGKIELRTFDSEIIHFVGNQHQVSTAIRKHLDKVIPLIYEAASEELVINELEGWLQRYHASSSI